MSEPITIVLATTNQGKVAELRALLADLPVELASVRDVLGQPLHVVEDGATFQDNALLKARAVSQATHAFALADDSGLEVDALAGRPGVHSARFAHERATDAENNAALLRELAEVEESARSARFRCVLVLVNPWRPSQVLVAEGQCEGSIAFSARGHGGFGYDPLFIVTGHDGKSMAELGDAEKNRVSHRGKAVLALRHLLLEVIDERRDRDHRPA